MLKQMIVVRNSSLEYEKLLSDKFISKAAAKILIILLS